jgi:hypothetical protein
MWLIFYILLLIDGKFHEMPDVKPARKWPETEHTMRSRVKR